MIFSNHNRKYKDKPLIFYDYVFYKKLLIYQQNESDIQSMETFQKAQVPGDAYVATAKVKRNESIKLAMKGFARKCIMFSPPIRQFIWENSIYTLDGREVSLFIVLFDFLYLNSIMNM